MSLRGVIRFVLAVLGVLLLLGLLVFIVIYLYALSWGFPPDD